MASRKPAGQRRLEIADATLGLAASLGPERLTVRDVAAALGITEPAVFRHFPTKDALWEAVVARLAQRLAERWAAARETPRPALDGLRALLRRQLELIAAEPGLPAILLSDELHRRSPALRQALAALMRRFHQAVERAVSDAQAAGALRGDRLAAQIAWALIALIQGVILRWSISERGFDLVEETMALIELMLHGLRSELP